MAPIDPRPSPPHESRWSFRPIGYRAARAAAMWAALVPLPTAWAQKEIARVETEKGLSRLALTAVFDPPPPSGFLPVIAEATNATGAKRTWRISFTSSENWNGEGGIRSSFQVAAEPGSAQTTLLVPLSTCAPTGSWRYGGQHNLMMVVNAEKGGTFTPSEFSDRVKTFPSVALSDALAISNLTQLNDALSKLSGGSYGADKTFGSRFKVEQLPDNWLGYSGFDHVMLTSDEWLSAAPGVRTAILQAVDFGMHLHLYRPNDTVTLGSLGFAEATANAGAPLRRGMGRIHPAVWEGSTLNATQIVADLSTQKSETLVHRASSNYAHDLWGARDMLGERGFAGWQVIGFLIVFGMLIGPVNLFLLAPAGRRHRLFLTTPLISLGASLALIGLILFQDGTGGSGRRFIAVHLPAGQAAAHVTQEQICRTGVVLGSSFTLPRPGSVLPLMLPESQWTKYHDGGSAQAIEGRIEGAEYSGNWFQSRTVQAQALRSIVPTRGRIELVPPKSDGDPPSIVSSLDLELVQFTCRTADGTIWRAPGPVVQGRAIPLVKAESSNWKKELSLACSNAHSDTIDSVVHAVAEGPAYFATTRSAPGLAIDTLKAIRWIDDQIVVFGTFPATP